MKYFLSVLLVILHLSVNAQGSISRPIFDKKTIGDIKITLPAVKWWEVLDSLRLYGEDMLTGTAEIDGQTYQGVGVRFRGNNSYQLGNKRNPMAIKLDHTEKDQNHQGYSSLKLSSALRDPSMVREMLFFEIAEKYMPAPQTSYTKVYINSEYVGVFINIEGIDSKFLEKHYQKSGNALYKANVDYPSLTTKFPDCIQNTGSSLEMETNPNCYMGNFEVKNTDGYEKLHNLATTLKKDPQNAYKILDIDRTLWMHALNNATVNLNSYLGLKSPNYYLYEDAHGIFQPIAWDLNLAFGSFKNTGVGSDLELKDLQRLDPMLHADKPNKPLISQLLQDPLYKKMYFSHLRQIIDENFHNGWYEKRAQELQGMIVVPYSQDENKLYTLDQFQLSLKATTGKRTKIPGISELMSKRIKYLRAYPDLTVIPSGISDVVVKKRAKFEAEKIETFHVVATANRYPKRSFLFYRSSSTKPYTMVAMNNDTAASGEPGENTYSIKVPAEGAEPMLEYYIMVENAGSVSFSPSNYTQKPYTVKLSDLNK